MSKIVVGAMGASKKHAVMHDTWGHLYPEPGSKHDCKILVMSHNGSTTMLDRKSDLDGSPMEFQLVCSILDMYDFSDGLHEIHCVLWFYKTCNDMYLGKPIGKIIKPKVIALYSTSNW